MIGFKFVVVYGAFHKMIVKNSRNTFTTIGFVLVIVFGFLLRSNFNEIQEKMSVSFLFDKKLFKALLTDETEMIEAFSHGYNSPHL